MPAITIERLASAKSDGRRASEAMANTITKIFTNVSVQ